MNEKQQEARDLEEEVADDEGECWQDDKVMPIEGHLAELRARIIRSVGFFFLACILSFSFSDTILGLITRTAANQTFIFLSPLEPIMVKLKMAVLCGLILAIPSILFEAWAFISPGLKPDEQRYSFLFVPPILICFAMGALFAYFIFLPVAVTFFLQMAGPGLEAKLSIGQYTEFTLMFMLLFGILAELPLVLLFLGKVGLVSSDYLVQKRPTLIVAIFLFAGIFTPPDWVTQVLVAIPVLLLFEAGILALRIFGL